MIIGEYSAQFHIRDESENFICPECGLKFVTSVKVDQHLRVHTGEAIEGENCLENNEEVVDHIDSVTATNFLDKIERNVGNLKDVDFYESLSKSEIDLQPFGNVSASALRHRQPIEHLRSVFEQLNENGRSLLRQPIENEIFEKHPTKSAKSESSVQHLIKEEYSNQHIKAQNLDPYLGGNVSEYKVKRETYHSPPIDYEIKNELIYHLQTATSFSEDHLNAQFSEVEKNFRKIKEESGYEISSLKTGDVLMVCQKGENNRFLNLGAKRDSVEQCEEHSPQMYTYTPSTQVNTVSPIHKESENTLQRSQQKFFDLIDDQNPASEEESTELSCTGPLGDELDDDSALGVRFDHVSSESVSDISWNNSTNTLPILEKFSPLKNKRDTSPSMPRLEPILPINFYDKDSNTKVAKGPRIGQMKKQIVSKYRKSRQFACESLHCYKTFYSHTDHQKHMLKFHPGYVPASAKIFTTPRPVPKSNKPKMVKNVRFSEKNQIHIIQPVFNIPHGRKNGKYVCLKCKGGFDDILDLREHLKKFKSKLHCDKIKQTKKKGKRSFKQANSSTCGNVKLATLLEVSTDDTESDQLTMDTSLLDSKNVEKGAQLPYFDTDPVINSEIQQEKNANLKTRNDNGKITHACSKCSKVFAYKKSLINHQNNHNDEDYRCEFCPLAFTRKEMLANHAKRQHKEKLQCPICHCIYVYKNNLTNHMKKKHNVDFF